MYSGIVAMLLFLANLKPTKLEIVRGVKLLEEAYPSTFSFVRKTNTKPGAYRRAIYFLVSWRPLSNYVQGKNSHCLS